MKIYLLLIISCFGLLLPLNAQNYYHLRSDGNLPKGYYLDKIYENSKKILLNEPNNDAMSIIDRIPFDFYFYGKLCKSYRVSDNGYLTFDTLSIDSQEPSSNYPANSIFGFWKDFKMQKLPPPNQGVGIQVFSYTDGVAPNRRHIVQFFGLSLASDQFTGPISNASIYAFAIIFHEGSEGRFDLVYTPYGDKNQLGAMGCSNDDNTQLKLINDSIAPLPFQFSFDKSRFIVYQFHYGTQKTNDLSLKSMNVGSIYQVNGVVNFSGTVVNNGKTAVNSFKLNYSINQGDTISYDINSVNIAPNGVGSYDFLHPLSWTSGAAGSLNQVNFFISHPNNQTDEDSANSHYNKIVLRNNLNYVAPRRVLFEEGTGAWCGYCPEAHLILKQAKSTYGDRVVAVSYHNDDSMSIDVGDRYLNTYVTSYPDAILDRKVFLGSNNTWLTELANRLNGNAPVDIIIDLKSYNLQTREISYRVTAKFSDYYYGNFNLGSIVTEDKVRGNALANIWSQNNYYSKDHNGGVGGPGHPLYNEKEYMDGYIHNSVVKAMPGGIWGVSGLIPQFITPNSEFSQTFTYKLPEAAFVSYDIDNNTNYCSTVDLIGQNEGRNIPANINLIGYVAENDSDYFNRPIINAGQSRLWNLVSIKDDFKDNQLSVYPNPTNDLLNINFISSSISSNALLSVFDATGKEVLVLDYQQIFQGENVFFVDITNLSSGLYTLHLQNGAQSFIEKIIKQ